MNGMQRWTLVLAVTGCAWLRGGEAVASPPQPRVSAEQGVLRPGDIDRKRSRAYVFVDKTGLGHQHAVVGQVASGAISLGAADRAGFVEFDMTTFTADTAEARRFIGLTGEVAAATQEQVTANMLSKDVLDVRQYPTARFDITRAIALPKHQADEPDRYQLEGSFTLHGVTHKVRVVAEVERADGAVRLKGGFKIRQTDFGMTPYTAALGTVGVADELQIWGDLWVAAGAGTR